MVEDSCLVGLGSKSSDRVVGSSGSVALLEETLGVRLPLVTLVEEKVGSCSALVTLVEERVGGCSALVALVKEKVAGCSTLVAFLEERVGGCSALVALLHRLEGRLVSVVFLEETVGDGSEVAICSFSLNCTGGGLSVGKCTKCIQFQHYNETEMHILIFTIIIIIYIIYSIDNI